MSVTLIPKPYSDQLFYALNLCYLILGILSIGWKQAIQNIIIVTVPVIILIMITLLVIPFMKGDFPNLFSTLNISFTLWGFILIIALPLFALGLGLRRGIQWLQ